MPPHEPHDTTMNAPEIQRIDIDRLIRAAKREVAMRTGFYAKKVAAGQMTREAADDGINDMQVIAVVLAAIKDDRPELPTLRKAGWVIPPPDALQAELF